jgi:hypothetical protein
MKFRIQTVARLLVAVLLVICALTEGVWCAAQGQATGQTAASSQSVLLKEGTEMKLKFRLRGQGLSPSQPSLTPAGRDAGRARRSWPEAGIPEDQRFDGQVARHASQTRKGKGRDGDSTDSRFRAHRTDQARQECRVQKRHTARGLRGPKRRVASTRLRLSTF